MPDAIAICSTRMFVPRNTHGVGVCWSACSEGRRPLGTVVPPGTRRGQEPTPLRATSKSTRLVALFVALLVMHILHVPR